MIDQTNAEVLNKAIDLAKQGVVSAFETVKQYAPYVWSMARRQTMLDGIEILVGWFILLITWIAAITWSYRAHKDENNYWDDNDHAVLFWVATAIFVILTLIMMPDAMDLIFNPDYWTMKKILELIHSH